MFLLLEKCLYMVRLATGIAKIDVKDWQHALCSYFNRIVQQLTCPQNSATHAFVHARNNNSYEHTSNTYILIARMRNSQIWWEKSNSEQQ